MIVKPLKGKVVVRVDPLQKATSEHFLLAKEYNNNYRDRSPVVAEVVEGNKKVKKGQFLLCHHNLFYSATSPYRIQGDLYSIPFNENIYAWLDEDGLPHPLNGNILAERVKIETAFELTPEFTKNYINRVTILSDGLGFKSGQQVFTWPYSDHEIIYMWKGKEKRVIKINIEDIVAYID